MTAEQQKLLVALKEEVPERSLDRILTIIEEMKLLDAGILSRSTLHRVLQGAGVSGRPKAPHNDTDLDRFEANFSNELWQSDLLQGPWLPDPQRPEKMRRAVLYAYIDDHSRLLLHGRFSFKGDLPALELVLRRCLQRWGLCRTLYYDNGATYRAHHMKHIVAQLSIHPIIYTTRYRPMGHGKVEALNRLMKSAFIAEVKASSISTLDALNEAFLAWADSYNKRTHSETGQAPLDRFKAGLDHVTYAEEEKLRLAFLWREERTPDKAGCFGLLGHRYQVDSQLGRKRIQVRYDPEALDEIEVWYKDRFAQRCRPFEVQRHRRPQVNNASDKGSAPPPFVGPPVANYLGHLVETRRANHFIEPDPSVKKLIDDARDHRNAANQALIDLLIERLDSQAVNIAAAQGFLDRYGPFDLESAETVLDRLLSHQPADQHVTFYLEAIRKALCNTEDER